MMSCPVCGATLEFGFLEIPEDDGSVGKLLTFDCPAGDYLGTLTEAEIQAMFTREVIRRLQRRR